MNIRKLVRPYGDDFATMFEWNHSGSEVGYLSNMIVVYVWSLFEEFIRDVYLFINEGQQINEQNMRKNTQGWSNIRKWLNKNKLLSDYLITFEPLIGELDARRNCLVHKNGKVDSQYINQANKYCATATFKLGDNVWTDWKYHEQLEKDLTSFQMLLTAIIESSINNNSPIY